MTYNPNEWKHGYIITADKLNHMEQGIEDSSENAVESEVNGEFGYVHKISVDPSTGIGEIQYYDGQNKENLESIHFYTTDTVWAGDLIKPIEDAIHIFTQAEVEEWMSQHTQQTAHSELENSFDNFISPYINNGEEQTDKENETVPSSTLFQTELDKKLNISDIDSELKEESENPVQNKIITNSLNELDIKVSQNSAAQTANKQQLKNEIAVERNRLNNIITQNPNEFEKILYSGDISNGIISLSDNIFNFNYIDIYLEYKGTVGIQTCSRDLISSSPDNKIWVRSSNIKDSNGEQNNPLSISEMQIQFNFDNNNKQAKINANNQWFWNGNTENSPSWTNAGDTNLPLAIKKIIGRYNITNNELSDARIDINGNNYTSVGDAIRAQYTVLNDKIDTLGDDFQIISDVNWTQGNIKDGVDSNESRLARVRSVGYTPTDNIDYISVDRSEIPWQTYILYFDEEKNHNNTYTAQKSIFTIDKNWPYFRIVCIDRTRHPDSSSEAQRNGWLNPITPEQVDATYTFWRQSGIVPLYKISKAQAYLSGGAKFSFKRSGNHVTLNFGGASSLIIRYNDGKGISIKIKSDDPEEYSIMNDLPTGWTFTDTAIISPNPSCGLYYDVSDGSIKFASGINIHQTNKDYIILFENHYNSGYFGLLVDYAIGMNFWNNSNNNTIPDYYFTNNYLDNKVNQIINNMSEVGPNGETFIFITDLHWEQNTRNSPALIKYILDNTNINLLLCGGDLINEGSKDEMKKAMQKAISAFKFADIPMYCAFGNHDSNWNDYPAGVRNQHPERHFTTNECYTLMQKQTENYVTYFGSGFNFYFDKSATKTRFIFIDTGEEGEFNQTDALNTIFDSTPENYHIIIIAHWLRRGDNWITAGETLRNIIDEWNQSNANTKRIELLLGGHNHIDYSEPTSITATPTILTDCDCGFRSATTIPDTDIPLYAAATITEQAFDVFTINYTDHTIKAVRIGRGNDRQWPEGGN